jgi:hypothetical protein
MAPYNCIAKNVVKLDNNDVEVEISLITGKIVSISKDKHTLVDQIADSYGWRFSTCAFYLKPGQSHSFQMRLEVNDGDLLGCFIRYVNLPEVQNEFYSYDIPTWVSDLDATIFGPAYEPHLENHLPWFMSMAGNLPEKWANFLKKEKLSVAVNIGRHYLPWGDIISEGIYDGHYSFRQDSRSLDLNSYREKIDNLRS